MIHRRAARWLIVAAMSAMLLPGSVPAGEGGSGYSAEERERLAQALRAASVAGNVERLRQFPHQVGTGAVEAWPADRFRHHGGYGSKAWASLVGAAAQVGVDQAPVVGSFLVMGHEEATEREVRENAPTGADSRARMPREWVEDRGGRHSDGRPSTSRPARPRPRMTPASPRPQAGPSQLSDPSSEPVPWAGLDQCQVDPASGARTCVRIDGRGGAQAEVFDGQGRKVYDHRVQGGSPPPMPRYGVPGFPWPCGRSGGPC